MVKGSTILLLGASATVLACAAPKSNAPTVDLVAEFEGFRPSVYHDAVGLETVGYGHLCKKPHCAEVQYHIPLTKEDGKKLLADDMGIAEKCIYSSTFDNVKLNANQYGALVSWAFNIGCGNVKKSDLIKSLNSGEDPNAVASRELPQWNKAGGRVLPGLTRRRKEEVTLFNTPTNDPALPACVNPPPPSTTSHLATPTTHHSTHRSTHLTSKPTKSRTKATSETSTASTHLTHSTHHTKHTKHTKTHSHSHTHTFSTPSTLSTVKSTSAWGNSSTVTPTSSVVMTTSVAYTTEVHTITHCPETVTNCPVGPHTTTTIIPLYTTVCPVTSAGPENQPSGQPTDTVVPVPTGTGSLPSDTNTWTAPSETCHGNCTVPAPTSLPPVSSGTKTGVSVMVMFGAITALLL